MGHGRVQRVGGVPRREGSQPAESQGRLHRTFGLDLEDWTEFNRHQEEHSSRCDSLSTAWRGALRTGSSGHTIWAIRDRTGWRVNRGQTVEAAGGLRREGQECQAEEPGRHSVGAGEPSMVLE